MEDLANRLEEAIVRITGWGVSIHPAGRLHKAVRLLRKVSSANSFPESHENLIRVAHAARDAQEFAEIGGMLPDGPLHPVAIALKKAVKGKLSKTGDVPHQFQSELWVGAMLTCTGTTVHSLPGPAHPEYLVTNGNMGYGIEVKRPIRSTKVRRRVYEGVKQLDLGTSRLAGTTYHGGALAIDLTDCLAPQAATTLETGPPNLVVAQTWVASQMQDLHRIVYDGSAQRIVARCSHIFALAVIARLIHWDTDDLSQMYLTRYIGCIAYTRDTQELPGTPRNMARRIVSPRGIGSGLPSAWRARNQLPDSRQLTSMPQLEHIEAIERRLWSAADTLRANSGLASNEYFLPVMGLVFLRHAYSRYLAVKPQIEARLPKRGGISPSLTKEDFSQRNAIFLRAEAQFDYLVSLPDSVDRAQAIINAMESIESDYESLLGALPKSEYRELANDVLGQLLRKLNPEELKVVSGDVFGRIYEYFLTRFADQKAHDGGEFFTPVSLVSLIAHVLDPGRGTLFDPACGSGGMFVQSARTVEEQGFQPTERLTFRGLEKNATTIRLARMNLAVHGLEGDIQQAITYYEDPHGLVGKADYVMANPPFNVDEIDAGKVKSDPRLPFGLPGVNKHGRVSNGNYIWISYFHSYLSERGRAGFVMSSHASGAGKGEAKVRQKLIESGDVDVMIAIRSNFFYTRTVPCELWFLNRNKPAEHRDRVLMVDARNIFRQVTRRICDFSPEQQKNLLAIIWLYRGETARFRELVSDYLWSVVEEAKACFELGESDDGDYVRPLPDYVAALDSLCDVIRPFLDTLPTEGPHVEPATRLNGAQRALTADIGQLKEEIANALREREATPDSSHALSARTMSFEGLAHASRACAARVESTRKLAARLINVCEEECEAKSRGDWASPDINRARKALDVAQDGAVEQLKLVGYFWRQAKWLTVRFPDVELRDVEGLVKLVDLAEIKANDWSLTPGRYVGVAPKEEEEGFVFGDAIHAIHEELEELNREAVTLAKEIQDNLLELVV